MIALQDCAGPDDVFRLAVVKADGPDIRLQPSTPSAWMVCAVFATGNNRAVALLTPFVGGLGRQDDGDQQLEREE